MNRIAAGLCLCAAIVAAPAFGQREAFRRNPPPAEPLFELRLPEIQSAVITNGLDVSVVARERSGMSSVQLLCAPMARSTMS